MRDRLSNRKGDPSTTTIDQKWFNNFAGSFTSTEAITKLKFYSHKGSAYAAGSTNYTGGSVTTIYEGEGSGSSGGTGTTDKISEGNTEAEVVDTGSDGHFKVTTEGNERLRITSNGNVGIGTSVPNDPVTSSNTAKLAVGIVTCHELYVNGTQITGSGSGNNQTWLADYQNVQSEQGSSVEWTGIPEDTQRIIIMFHDVSPGSNEDWLVQLGNTSGNYSAGVYDSSSTAHTGNQEYSADGFIINVSRR